jgi:signal transduction histidine kinase
VNSPAALSSVTPAGAESGHWLLLSLLTLPVLALADFLWFPLWPLLPAAGTAILWLTHRRAPRVLILLAVALLLLPVALRLDLDRLSRAADESPARSQAIAGHIQAQASALESRLLAQARQIAALPETRSDWRDSATLASLFAALERLRGQGVDDAGASSALGVRSPTFAPVAWSGRIASLGSLPAAAPQTADVFVVSGPVSSTLIAAVPVVDAGGHVRGLASAERQLGGTTSWHSPISSDRDPLTEDAPGVEIAYRDMRRPTPIMSAQEQARDRVWPLRAPDGDVLGLVRLTASSIEKERRSRAERYRPLAALLLGAFLMVWAAQRRSGARLALALTLLRGGLWALALFPLQSTLPLSAADPDLGALVAPVFGSPLDIWLSAAWTAALAAVWTVHALGQPEPARPGRAVWLTDALCLPVVAGALLWAGETVRRYPREFDMPSLLPSSLGQTLLCTAVFLELVTAGLLVFTLARRGTATARRGSLFLRLLVWMALFVAISQFWPRAALGVPLLPALALLLAPAAAALAVQRRTDAPGRLSLALLCAATLALLYYPTVAHYAEKRLRWAVERVYVPMVLDQPRWRAETLSRSCVEIDALHPIEDEAPPPAAAEELAYSLWSQTDLARYGFSSALEVRDASGALVSRFGQNLAWLATPAQSSPRDTAWEIGPERVTVGSATRAVLHARRLVSRGQRVRGSIHLYVADDHWNLPFLTERDPYALVVRGQRVEDPSPGRPLLLLTYDWSRRAIFASIERPPLLPPLVLDRLRREGRGFWTTLDVAGSTRHLFVFQDANGPGVLGYARLGGWQFVASTVEAAAGLALVILALLVVLLLARSLMGRQTLSLASLRSSVRGSFAIRLSVAFVAVAAVPALALQVSVRGFVVDRLKREAESQALERAMVAQKAVEDFALFQGDQATGGQTVTDKALVWIASLIHNDIDLFEQGRVSASSKRELYASGLLPTQVDGRVYRALVLDRAPFCFSSERLDRLAFQVVSVPVRLRGAPGAILSVPLASREREMQAVLGDMNRALRLALVLCIAGAGALAHFLARRLSEPVAALTRATRRITAGDLSVQVASSSQDELSGLVQAFNRMAADLTRQRDELEQTHRVAAWAEMAREVAHEVKNPLTPIQLSAEHLQRVFGDPAVDFRATLETCTQTILRQVRALRGIVTEFGAFARPLDQHPEPIDLGALVADVAGPYRAGLPPGITLVVANEPSQSVLGDRRLIERAVVNLIENALQAVAGSGVITLRIAPSADGQQACVTVIDNGPGLDLVTRSRAFEPFFSTKSSGSGLGLALVKKTALEHHGDVRLESEPGQGTRVVLSLPVMPPASRDSS